VEVVTSQLAGMAGIETITTMMVIITVTMAPITGMVDTTGIETTIREGGMIGLEDASLDCIVHSGDLWKLFGVARFIFVPKLV
jgi:hypothetical protein